MILWSLASSDAIQAKIKESYKQARHDDDLNQPLSVQPWGRDSLKRRYWLIEGQDDTHFRLYRESNPALKNVTWWSVAGDIPEMLAVADRLLEEKNIHSKKLSERIQAAIPRFEASEEVSHRTFKDLTQGVELIYQLMVNRSASAATIASHEKLLLLDRSLASRCMKAALVAKNSSTPTTTMKIYSPMNSRLDALHGIPLLQLPPNKRALNLQQADDKSGPELGAHTERHF